MSADSHLASDAGRGQTSVDLVVGLTLFVVTITVILGQIPTFLAPYQEQATPVVADRAADELLSELAASGASTPPSTLDEPCVVAFFEGADGDTCRFDTSESVRERLGISSLYAVNVSLVHDGDAGFEVLCHDGSQVVTCGTDPLRVGPAVPTDRGAVSVTYRGVQVNGSGAVVVVRVWQR